jgi:hypothetical protein
VFELLSGLYLMFIEWWDEYNHWWWSKISLQ